MKRMLFNATQQEELRVAIVDGQKLIDIDIETTGREQRKSNIYKGVITRIEPSLEACFVNYGEERHGFLPFKEVARTYFREGVDVRNASIKEALREGQEIMIQVEKEERGNKGAALTSFVSLAGRYLVLMPNNPRGGGVSRRVEGEDRQELRETMDKLDLPPGMSVIARTAGIGRNVEELQWDLNYLMQLWRAIEGAGKSAPGAFLIYQESSLVIRAIRDYFQPDIGEILIDTDDIFEQAQQFMSHVMPDMVHRVKRYRDDVPLFSRFQIEHQIESAYSRTVPLPSGGAIVIDHTEALVSVDVNSARATRGSDIETTAYHTNLEAADEVARQLRLRDLGGLIVIDFIDMENTRNQREVENRLKDALHYDRARVQMGKISRFGLMELSRQRLRPSLSEGSHITCPRCNGTGHIRDTDSSALQVLRVIQEEAMKENSAAIHVQVPVDVAAFLLNEKRGEVLKIETRHRVTIVLIPNKYLETPHYKLERLKHDDPRLEESQSSYSLAEAADTDIGYGKRQKEELRPRQEAVVKGITPDQPAPTFERKPEVKAPVAPVAAPEEGFLSKLFGLFRAKPVATSTATAAVEKPAFSRERSGSDRNSKSRSGSSNSRSRSRNSNSRDRNEGDNRSDNRTEGRNDSRTDNRSAGRDGQADRSRQPAEAGSQQRAPRPPKGEPRDQQRDQQREPREARDARERGQDRPQQERTPRPPREERKDGATQGAQPDGRETAVAGVAAAVAAIAHGEEPIMLNDAATALGENAGTPEGTGAAATENGQPARRRRRRGGRGRGRRDQEGGDSTPQSSDSADSADIGDDEDVSDETPVTQHAGVAVPVSAASKPAPASTIPSGLATMERFAPSGPVKGAREYGLSIRGITSENAAAPAPQPLPQATIQPSAPPVQPNVQPAPQAPVAPIQASIPAPAPVAAPAVPQAAPPAASSRPAQPAAVPQAAMQLDELQHMLSAAGLSLAVTDPQKLRAAQDAAANTVQPPRIPRERKPLPPVSNEPLVQVETQR